MLVKWAACERVFSFMPHSDDYRARQYPTEYRVN